MKRRFSKENYEWMTDNWQQLARKKIVTYRANTVVDLSIEEIKYSSIPYQLHSEDRNSMMFSIESRLPFLCPRLVEYTIGLDDKYKIKNAYTKYVLRQAVPEMPLAIRERKDKMGFVSPDEVWMKRNKDLVRLEIQESIDRYSIFSDKLLLKFDDFTDGKGQYDSLFFRVISFNRFCKLFKMTILSKK